MLYRFIPLLATAALCGCAHTAVVRSWEPAEIDVGGMERIAVLDFVGEHGDEVSATLTSELWENEFYSLVDRSEIQPVLRTAGFVENGESSLDGCLEAARDAGIDGLVFGEVLEYTCEDQTSHSTVFHFGDRSGAPSPDEEASSFPRRGPLGFSRRETLTRTGQVTLVFRLVDVETGEVRASRRITREFEQSTADSTGELPSRDEVLDTLLDRCVGDVVAMLAPHEIDCSMKLAKCEWFCRGRRDVQQGNELARSGQWSDAERKWEQALEENSENDAALFNLAIAAAHRQDYSAAEDLAMRALRIRHTDCYAAGLAKIRAQRTAYGETQSQRDARVVHATGSLWQQ